MKKMLLIIAALALTGQVFGQSPQNVQQSMNKFFKYQYTFTNTFYYSMTVKLKFADGTTQTNTVQAASYPNGATTPMSFLSNACLTDVWVSGSIPVGGSSAIGVSGGSSETVSTDHHNMNICTSKAFTIIPISNSPYVQLNW